MVAKLIEHKFLIDNDPEFKFLSQQIVKDQIVSGKRFLSKSIAYISASP